MKKTLASLGLLGALVLGGVWLMPQPVSQAQVQLQVPSPQLAAVEQLRSEVMQALKDGQFERDSGPLARVMQSDGDPQLTQMVGWVDEYQQQRQSFAAQRHSEYEDAVKDVHTLLEHDKDAYALDAATRAYGLADDKTAFRAEQWVDDLIHHTAQMAAAAEDEHDWISAMRLYSDLAAVEPGEAKWKDKLKSASRRVRLLALYAPDQLKKYQDAQADQREQVDRLLHPDKVPTTQPVAVENDAFKTSWRDTLQGIQPDMLWDALQNIHDEYYRDVRYDTLTLGGLSGLESLVTTEGLETAFPSLADESKKAAFSGELAQLRQEVKKAPQQSQQLVLRNTLAQLKIANSRSLELPEEVVVNEFSDGVFATLDPFSNMIWPSDVADFMRQTQGEFSGVGIQIQSDDNMDLKVVSPLEDTPAYQAGIKAGDIIVAIDGQRARGISLNDAVKRITGPKGTFVALTIRRQDGTVKEYRIKRETIKVASVKGWEHIPGGGWNYFIDPDQKLGYIRISSFTKTTAEDFGHAVDVLTAAGARGFIIDLRYNPGGLLIAATEVSDRLLSSGVIVSTRADRPTPNPPSITMAKSSRDDSSLPVVVLVNQYSASASEIVSGALKDQHRALIVGERTFGKGSVQMLFPLNSRTALVKLTTSHYYLPSGRSIHREENSTTWGVDPDVTVEMTPSQMRAAIDARQELDILRDAQAGSDENAQPLEQQDQAETDTQAQPSTQPSSVDPLAADTQLSTALLLLRLQLTTAPALASTSK